MIWGQHGHEPPCDHLIELRNMLGRLRLSVWAEQSIGGLEGVGDGWVNVHCKRCHKTYEVNLTAPGGREPLDPLQGGE